MTLTALARRKVGRTNLEVTRLGLGTAFLLGLDRVGDAAPAIAIQIHVTGFGVARDPAKRAALADVCTALFDDVNAALAALGGDV